MSFYLRTICIAKPQCDKSRENTKQRNDHCSQGNVHVRDIQHWSFSSLLEDSYPWGIVFKIQLTVHIIPGIHHRRHRLLLPARPASHCVRFYQEQVDFLCHKDIQGAVFTLVSSEQTSVFSLRLLCAISLWHSEWSAGVSGIWWEWIHAIWSTRYLFNTNFLLVELCKIIFYNEKNFVYFFFKMKKVDIYVLFLDDNLQLVSQINLGLDSIPSLTLRVA